MLNTTSDKKKLIRTTESLLKNTNPYLYYMEANFFERVYDVARLIPEGRVTSYGAIANYLGSKGSARMVGWAMNGCGNLQPPVPAHRVVNRNGLLTGKHHFPTPDLMEKLLQNEGIGVKNDKIQNLKKYYWDPVIELPPRGE